MWPDYSRYRVCPKQPIRSIHSSKLRRARCRLFLQRGTTSVFRRPKLGIPCSGSTTFSKLPWAGLDKDQEEGQITIFERAGVDELRSSHYNPLRERAVT